MLTPLVSMPLSRDLPQACAREHGHGTRKLSADAILEVRALGKQLHDTHVSKQELGHKMRRFHFRWLACQHKARMRLY